MADVTESWVVESVLTTAEGNTVALRRATWWAGSNDGPDDPELGVVGVRGSWFSLEPERIHLPDLEVAAVGEHYVLNVAIAGVPFNHPEYVGLE